MLGGAMVTQAVGTGELGRFRSLLAGKGGDHDHVLLETHGCLVAPTLGSIIPNWLLVVPRRLAVSFRDWQTNADIGPIQLVSDVLGKLDVTPRRAIWFEHGPATEGSVVGCGVDYAHLHILIDAPFTSDELAAASMERGDVLWREASAFDAYASLSHTRSYLVVGSLRDVLIAEGVENVGSQFFRRVIADIVGRPEQWNYRTHAHMENVRETVSTFGPRALV